MEANERKYEGNALKTLLAFVRIGEQLLGYALIGE